MPLVAGVDSSTQSCKVVIVDLETGALVRHGRAPHPQRTEVHPDIWWSALSQAIEAAGGIEDMSGIAVAAQQHGMICLDEAGEVVRPAILWNDPRPARAAADLVAEWGAGKSGQREWIRAVGVVPQPWELWAPLAPLYGAGKYAEVADRLDGLVAANPQYPMLFFNLACCGSLCGWTSDALDHLRHAIEMSEEFRASAKTDSDLDLIRDEPTFRQLINHY